MSRDERDANPESSPSGRTIATEILVPPISTAAAAGPPPTPDCVTGLELNHATGGNGFERCVNDRSGGKPIGSSDR